MPSVWSADSLEPTVGRLAMTRPTAVIRRVYRLIRLETHQSPLFFHGLLCLLWRLTDLVPGYAGYNARQLIGQRLFAGLGESAHISSHNTFFDGRNIEIGSWFSSGKYNYFAGGPIKIGDHVSVANYVIIETTGHFFTDAAQPIQRQGIHRKPVVVGNDVWIGDRVTVLGGVTVGAGSVIGAGAVVTKDIPPNSVVVGNPARVIRRRIE